MTVTLKEREDKLRTVLSEIYTGARLDQEVDSIMKTFRGQHRKEIINEVVDAVQNVLYGHDLSCFKDEEHIDIAVLITSGEIRECRVLKRKREKVKNEK